ncbi:MAG: PQQ-binding-like beta-propeller repeat protein [Pirellulaceae bacterium]
MNSRLRLLPCALVVLLAPCVSSGALWAAEDAYRDAYLETLRRHDIQPNAVGARRYLRELQPGANQIALIESLIAQLGHEDFRQREAASRQLLLMPAIPVQSLSNATQHENAEIRWRAGLILRQAEEHSAHVMHAALKIASSEQADGLVDDILAIVPLCRRAFLRDAAHEALRSAAGPNDVDALRRAIENGDPSLRVAATIGLTGPLVPERTARLHALLDDRDDHVALEAARGIGNRGDRAALAALVRLLDADDPLIRSQSAAMLQGMTGQNFDYASYSTPPERRAAVARWEEWILDEGRSAPLRFPVSAGHGARGSLHGHTLIATGSGKRVFELDASGKEVWHYDIEAWSAEKLRNGNVLIASYAKNTVIEVDREGKVVWSITGVSAMTAKPLHDGNILVADFSNTHVREYDRDKRVVWEHKTPGECFDADRLPNGNTIFGCPNLIQEVSPDGALVREWSISDRLNGFQALPNGNVIVANYGANAVYEMNPDGDRLWQVSEPQPCDVFQLPDGRLLVTTASRVVEVSADHKTIREICKAQYGSARR